MGQAWSGAAGSGASPRHGPARSLALGHGHVLLHGDDPYLELPIPSDILASCEGRDGLELEVELGWPMSGDFMALVEAIHPLEEKVSALRERATESDARATQSEARAAHLEAEVLRAKAHAEELDERRQELSEQSSVLSEQLHASMTHNQRLVEENPPSKASRWS